MENLKDPRQNEKSAKNAKIKAEIRKKKLELKILKKEREIMDLQLLDSLAQTEESSEEEMSDDDGKKSWNRGININKANTSKQITSQDKSFNSESDDQNPPEEGKPLTGTEIEVYSSPAIIHGGQNPLEEMQEPLTGTEIEVYSTSAISDGQNPSEEMPEDKPLSGTEVKVYSSSEIGHAQHSPEEKPEGKPLLGTDVEEVYSSSAINQDPPEEINILLLGETGVGKSTFINSFANYLKYASFDHAMEADLEVLIPASFGIFDREMKKRTIKLGGTDTNEYLGKGAAATQKVKTYIFHIAVENKNYDIRLIDTPGMGDPRGIDQDNENCENILNYIGNLKEIHAICLLLKPINTRLDVFLNYCVTEILSRLEKSATENIAFIFTNTRGQNYTPGDTYSSLEVLIQNIKETNNVSLSLGTTNVFCLDNEAFRFLASIKQGVQFKDRVLVANKESWMSSNEEVHRFISYIVNLRPHDPKKTISVNRARKMILQLSKPLADIAQLIAENIYILERQTKDLSMENQSVEELKKKLYMPIIDVRSIPLDMPTTVCTASKCTTTYQVAGMNKCDYKQECHKPCYLKNVGNIVGDHRLRYCDAMNKASQMCEECGCGYATHMHIYYQTETIESKIVDKNVLENVKTKEEAVKEKERMLKTIGDYKKQLEGEQKIIVKCTAYFAHFLRINAITPINDSLREYIKQLIKIEEKVNTEASQVTLNNLRRLLSKYEEEHKILTNALEKRALEYGGASNIIQDCSPSVIESKIKELLRLKNFGVKIQELYKHQQTGGAVEHKHSEVSVQTQYKLVWYRNPKTLIGQVVNKIAPKKKNEKERQQLEESQSSRKYLLM